MTYTAEDIQKSGATTTEQFMRTIPQNLSSTDSTTQLLSIGPDVGSVKNVSFGAGINLRGIGTQATLTLVDGHRFAQSGDGTFTDVSMIPLSAVERIEVLTDGASATYGADAVAGVVNLILKKDFTGAESTLRYGATSDGGGGSRGFSQLAGNSWGSGSAMLAIDYSREDPLRAGQRDFITANSAGAPVDLTDITLNPEQRRRSAFFNIHQEVSDDLNLAGSGFYSARDYTSNNLLFASTDDDWGSARQYGGDGEVSYLTGAWRSTLTGNFSRSEEINTDENSSTNDPITTGNDYTLTSVGLRSDGPLFNIPGGVVRASVGLDFRHEAISVDAISLGQGTVRLSRNIWSAYGEALFPVITASNPTTGVQRLEFSLAARYDHYGDFGSTTNPKIGAVWAPVKWGSFRGTYSTSFKPPTLLQSSDALQSYTLISVPNSSVPSGITNTIFVDGPGGASLKPEKAHSYSFGLDLTPESMKPLRLSATYFHISFKDRIALAPEVGGSFSIYDSTNGPALAPFINRNPTPAQIAAIASSPGFTNLGGPNFTGIDPALTNAIFDERAHNIASVVTSGLDLEGSYVIDVARGHVDLSLAGSKLFELSSKTLPSVPTTDLLDTTFEPMNLRLRGGVVWSTGPWATSIFANFASSYKDNLVVPTGSVASWTTFDGQLAFEVPPASSIALRGLRLSLSVINLFDRDPPLVANQINPLFLGYDGVNASPRGRAFSAVVSKRW
jgi:iron complex outermembrane receptor protein